LLIPCAQSAALFNHLSWTKQPSMEKPWPANQPVKVGLEYKARLESQIRKQAGRERSRRKKKARGKRKEEASGKRKKPKEESKLQKEALVGKTYVKGMQRFSGRA